LDSWTPAAAMASRRMRHTAALLPDGDVLVVGGETASAGTPLSGTERYHPATNSWRDEPPLRDARSDQCMVRLDDGRVFVVGGFGGSPASPDFLATAELYDPGADTWTRAPPMAVAREDLTATVLPGGKVLVAGCDNLSGALDSAELYDPTSNTWSPAGTMSEKRESPAAVLLATGKLLVVGGIDPGRNVGLTSADLYDPASNA